jgi:hypothetical protein
MFATRIRPFLLLLPLALLVAVGCSSSQKVLMPPRMDLAAYGTVGMVRFSPAGSAEQHVRASEEFLSALQSAQPGVPVLELGDQPYVLDAVEAETLDPDTVKRIGERFGVDVLLVGVLEAQEVKPDVSLGTGLESLRASAELEGALTARLYDTGSGATIWTTSMRGKETVARVDITSGGIGGIGASSTKDAEARLVDRLVGSATHDFRPYWVRQ